MTYVNIAGDLSDADWLGETPVNALGIRSTHPWYLGNKKPGSGNAVRVSGNSNMVCSNYLIRMYGCLSKPEANLVVPAQQVPMGFSWEISRYQTACVELEVS